MDIMLKIRKRKVKTTCDSGKLEFNDLRSLSKQERKPNSSVFQDIGEQEVHALYSWANIKKLQPGDTLYREDDIADSVYVILQGQLRIVKNRGEQEIEIAVLREGDWIIDVDFTKQIIRTGSAIAVEPATIMIINKNIFGKLDDKVQLFLLKKMQGIAAERIIELAAEKEQLKKKNQKLIANIFSVRCKAKTGSGTHKKNPTITNRHKHSCK